jgi:membrane protease YdiL (CAAX protease family)
MHARTSSAQNSSDLLITSIALLLAAGAAAGFFFVEPYLGGFPLSLVLSYVIVWIPLVAAILVVKHSHRWSWSRGFGLKFQWIDIAWGLGAAFIAHAAVLLIETSVLGFQLATSPAIPTSLSSLFSLLLIVSFGVVLSPLIEEVFFRGMLLRELDAQLRSWRLPGSVAVLSSVVLSSVLFGAVHIIGMSPGVVTFTVFASTMVFGIIAATLSTLTGRIGAAIIAHATFNALVLVPGLS